MILGKILGVASLGVTCIAAPAPGFSHLEARDNVYTIHTVKPKAIKAMSPTLPFATNTLPLYPQPGVHGVGKLNALRKAALAAAGEPPTRGASPILSMQGGTDYVAPVDFGGQTVYLLVDTGSSDTWAPQANFTCIDVMSYMPTRQANCGFRCTWNPGKSATATRVPGQRLEVTYGDGTFARGSVVTETVTVAQIQVVNQEIGSVNYTGWTGKGGDCGLMGLAFDSLDNAYPIGAPTGDAYRIHYDPLFTSMYKSNQIEPIFTVKIPRNDTGVLSLGGVPRDVKTTTAYANAPFEYTVMAGTSNSSFSFYTVNMTATWGPPAGVNASTSGSANGTTGAAFPGIVDSGTTGVYLPRSDSDAFNALWSPPAKADFNGATYAVECGATPPSLALNIAGTAFQLNPRDLVFYNGDGTCTSIVFGAGRATPKIIGDAFMRSVLVVHDVGAGMLRIAGTD